MEENPNSFDSAESIVRALGLDRPANPDGTYGPKPREGHKMLTPRKSPKTPFRVPTVRGKRVEPPPVVVQEPYDENEAEPAGDDYEIEPVGNDYSFKDDNEGHEAKVHIELSVPVSQLKRLLDAIS